MNVSPDRVVQLVREGLAPSLAADAATLALATELARDLVVYGERGAPRALFARASGIPVAAMICEDFEGAATFAPFVGERSVEIAHGFGLVAWILAVQHPDHAFETVEPNRERQWYLRRLCALHGVRNLVIHTDRPDVFVRANEGVYAAVLVKGLDPEPALALATPLLAPQGRIFSWQTKDNSADVRRPRRSAVGAPLRLERTLALASAPARGRVILCVGCTAQELDAALPTA